jgi:A/G-specific adenine glycosylase
MSADLPSLDPDWISSVNDRVLIWFVDNGRDLPWRHTRDPYRVLVAEVMLQQIQVSRAVPFYLAFLERFPTVQALAEAPIADVIRVWADLGRYRRIAFLHRAAREIVERFDGVVPSTIEELRLLPGVGPYTAGAVVCFAYEQDEGFVDTNVRRVIGRLVLGTEPTDSAGHRTVDELARRLVPLGRGWDWNQGLLDFGALHCTARRPKCDGCPLASMCAAFPVESTQETSSTKGKAAAERFEGSNRFYRGRILATLRERSMGENGDGISLLELGSTVKPEFESTDLPWLYGVVNGLAKDGLAVIAEDAAVYDAGNTGEPDHLSVRLP